MEILLDYHLVFIVIVFVLLLITVLLLFIEPTHEKAIAAIIIAGINGIICLISAYSFFRIGLIGFNSAGTGIVTAYEDMQIFFGLFMAFIYINAAFVLYGGMLIMKKPWDEIAKENVTPRKT